MHHSRLAAGCHFGSSLIQNGSQLIFGGGELTPVLSVGVTHCTGVTCYYVLCRFSAGDPY